MNPPALAVGSVNCGIDGISISSAGDHLWTMEISMQAGYGDFTAGFVLADGGFPISFKDQYTPPAPTPGLYYKELAEGPGDPPNEVGNYVPLESIDCAPFVDRFSFALYYQVRRKAPAFRHGDISRQRLLSLIRTYPKPV